MQLEIERQALKKKGPEFVDRLKKAEKEIDSLKEKSGRLEPAMEIRERGHQENPGAQE